MSDPRSVRYEVTGRVARLTLNRPDRGNGITLGLVRELSECVERADLDPAVHVLLLAGDGPGFCAGYDLVESAERMGSAGEGNTRLDEGDSRRGEEDTRPDEGESRGGEGDARTDDRAFAGSPLDPAVIAANHDPASTWDAMVDFAMMSRNVRGFMSLVQCGKPVVCKVHGFCVGGGTDMALCSDLLVIGARAKIGYPPARVWGSPTTALWAHRIGIQRAKRLLFTGDSLSGAEAAEWGLAIEAPPDDGLDERAEALVERVAMMPLNQLRMMKLLVNQTLLGQELFATQTLGTLLDGIARHTAEGYAFQRRAAGSSFKEAVRERDDPFGDAGRSTHKG